MLLIGAIFGVAGALAMFAWQHREMMGPAADSLLMRLRDTAAINLMYGVFFRRIDNWYVYLMGDKSFL